jgi:hypothetical protein
MGYYLTPEENTVHSAECNGGMNTFGNSHTVRKYDAKMQVVVF